MYFELCCSDIYIVVLLYTCFFSIMAQKYQNSFFEPDEIHVSTNKVEWIHCIFAFWVYDQNVEAIVSKSATPKIVIGRKLQWRTWREVATLTKEGGAYQTVNCCLTHCTTSVYTAHETWTRHIGGRKDRKDPAAGLASRCDRNWPWHMTRRRKMRRRVDWTEQRGRTKVQL